MDPTVHISADRKSDIPFVVHAEHAHSMVPVSAPRVCSFPAVKAEHFRKLGSLRIEQPEIVSLYEGRGRPIFIFFILDILRRDPEQDACAVKGLRVSVKNLFQFSVIIQQVYCSLHIPDAEKFRHIVQFILPAVIRARRLVFGEQGSVHGIALLNIPFHIAQHLGL